MVSESIRASYGSEKGFFASRYKQGTRTVFGVAMTPDQITGLVKRPDPLASTPGNRRIRLDHAKAFAQYFIDNDNWVVPGIILRAPSIFTFEQADEVPDLQFGTVQYHARNEGDIQILDGQHRILGFHLAIEILDDRAEKLRDKKVHARRADDMADVASIDRELRQIDKVRDRFSKERITVEIHVVDHMQAYRQMFYDIAENALGITASVKARFDTRKVVNRALATVLEDPRLINLVDHEADTIRMNNPMWISARTVMEITRSVTVGYDGRVTTRKEAELGEVEIAKNTLEFFDTIFAAFPQLESLKDGRLSPEKLRKTSMLGSPLFLRILAGVYYELRSEKHAWTRSMIQGFFDKLAPHVEAPAHENSIWKLHAEPEAFNLGAWGPNGRRQDAKGLVLTITDWAVLPQAAAFLDEEPLPAPAPQSDPDEGIDFAPFHDTKPVGVEERNAIDDIAVDSKVRARAVKARPPRTKQAVIAEVEPEKVKVASK